MPKVRGTPDPVLGPRPNVPGETPPLVTGLGQAIDSVLDPLLVLRPTHDRRGRINDFEILDANAAALEYVGRTRPEFVGHRVLQTFPSHQTSGVFASLAHCYDTGDTVSIDGMRHHSDVSDTDRIFDMRAARAGDLLTLTWRNVTERHELAERYRILAEYSSDIVSQVDLDGVVRWVSPTLRTELGYEPEDVVGHHLSEFGEPSGGRDRDALYADLAAHGRLVTEVRVRAADGGLHQFSIAVHNVLDDDGRVTSLIVGLRNIDEEVATRQSLELERDAYGAALREGADPFVLLRAVREGGEVVDFEYLEVNAAVPETHGLTADEMVGHRFSEIHPHAGPAVVDLLREAVVTGQTVARHGMSAPVDGHPRRIDIRVTPVGDVVSSSWHDVTGLTELLEHYRLLAENASDVVFQVDADLSIRWISPSVTEMTGWSAAEVTGRPISDYCHPDDLDAIARAIDLTPTGDVGDVEFRIRRADGTFRWVHVVGRDLETGSGVGYIGSLRDAEAEHASRAAQADSEARYRLLAENSSDVILVSQAGGPIRWVSESVADLVGWRPEEMVGRRFAEFVPEEDQSRLDAGRELVERGEVARLRLRVTAKDGAQRWISSLTRDAVDPVSGELQRISSWRDADDEVHAEQRLAESELNFRLLAENASDVVWRTDLDGVVTWVSPSIAKVLGRAESDVLGRSALELASPDDQAAVAAALDDVRAGGVVSGRELRFTTASGAARWMSVHVGTARLDDRTTSLVWGLRDAERAVASRRDLAASESRFRLLAENASDVVLLLDEDLAIDWASPSVVQVLGWRPATMTGRPVSEFWAVDAVGGDAPPATLEDVGRLSQVRVRRADGSLVWMSVRSKAAFDDRARPSGRVVALRDIGAEVLARETLISSESRYRLLAENATDVVLELDASNHLTWVSPSVQRMLGWRPEEWVGHDTLEFIHPDDVEAVRDFRRRSFAGEAPPTLEARYRAADGSFHWMSGEDHAIRGRTGGVTTRIVGLRNVDAERAARDQLVAAESRYRLLAENASDVVMEIDLGNTVTWVSPSAATVFGLLPEDMIGQKSWERVLEEDRAKVIALRTLVFLGERVEPYLVRARRADGEVRWMTAAPHAVHDERGAVTSVVLTIRDSQAEVLAARATSTLSAGSRALVRATDEHALFDEMCEIAAGEGGYALAWYGRKVDDDERTVEKYSSSVRNRAYVESITVHWSDGPLGRGPAGRAIRTGETVVVRDFLQDPGFEPWREAAERFNFRTSVGLPVRVGDEVDGVLMVYASEPDAFDAGSVAVLENLAAELGFGVDRLRDRQRLLDTLREQQLMTSAIEQADESVLILDPTFSIIYANPATERTSGYSIDEIIGQSPQIFGAGSANQEFMEEVWTTLSRGQAWHGAFINRRKNGELYEESASISPIHDEGHRLIAFVEVKNDVSTERRLQGLEDDVARALDDRTALLSVMSSVRAADNVHSTAYLFCDAARQLPGVEVAAILLIREDGDLLPISVVGADLPEVNEEQPIDTGGPEFLAALAERAQVLPLDVERYEDNRDLIGSLVAEGLVCVTLAPIRWQGDLIGVLALATRDPTSGEQMAGRLLYYEEIASYAGTLLGEQARSYERRSVLRAEIRDVIEGARFATFFQPQVDLSTGAVVGFEALTRFADATPPDRRIVDAHAVGLGAELEAALARAAVTLAPRLPEDVLLFINLSPSSLLDPTARRCVDGSARPVVVEVTEDAPIGSYDDVARAMDDLPGCRLAIDDAGAGYTSLTKIAQLHPAFVKLDISLVRDINAKPTLQAMVAGICHFAQQTGTVLIAEGIETEAEAETIRGLGAGLEPGHLLGQGFHFGRPAPLPEALSPD